MRGKIFNVTPLTKEQQIAKDLLFEHWKQTGKDPFVEVRAFRMQYPDLPFGQVFEALLVEVK